MSTTKQYGRLPAYNVTDMGFRLSKLKINRGLSWTAVMKRKVIRMSRPIHLIIFFGEEYIITDLDYADDADQSHAILRHHFTI